MASRRKEPQNKYYALRTITFRSHNLGCLWRIAQALVAFRYTPKISIVMPVYNTPLEQLDLAIRSMLDQHYENWELCICDDASPNWDVRARLQNWQKQDPRINVTYSRKHGGISEASKQALSIATGEFIGLLDHDDELSPDALFEVANLLQSRPYADIVYSDEDKLDPQGRRVCPHFKPDWSPEHFLSGMYLGHLGVYRRQLLEEIGGFRGGFDGAQDYDLALRAVEETCGRIYHISRVLYHRKMGPTSTATSADVKPHAHEAGKRALNEYLRRIRVPGEAVNGKWPSSYRIQFKFDATHKVSIIIPNLGEPDVVMACIESVKQKTSYCNYEIIVVGNHDQDRVTKQHLLSGAHKIISVEGSLNISRLLNRAATQAAGTYLLLLSENTEVISPDWMTSMLGFCWLSGIGAVGAKLLYRTGRLQHIGVVLGLKGLTGHPLRGFQEFSDTHMDPSNLIRNCSAVTGACMMVRKYVFDRFDGFDEQLPNAYNDIDFCLRLRQGGYRIVWTPDAQLYHDEPMSRSRADGRDAKYFKNRWDKVLKDDPYYNPNLTLQHEDLGYRV